MQKIDPIIRFFKDIGFVTQELMPSAKAVELSGEIHGDLLCKELLLEYEMFGELTVYHAMIRRHMERGNSGALRSVLEEMYDDSVLEIPAVFEYFGKDVPNHKEYIYAFCNGLYNVLGEYIYGKEERFDDF